MPHLSECALPILEELRGYRKHVKQLVVVGALPRSLVSTPSELISDTVSIVQRIAPTEFFIIRKNKMALPTILRIIFLLVAVSVVSTSGAEEACETLPSEIHIVKEEYDELGRLQRTCSGDIAVNKCEGACTSQVQPSVITPTGFLKECYCCRESFLRERVVSLSHCYDPDGMRLNGETNHSMDVKLREPGECRCYKCGDYSR